MALSEYKGEEIIANIIIRQGKKHEERVWMPRTVFNDINIYKNTNAYDDENTVVNQTHWAKQIYGFMQENSHISWTFVEGDLPQQFFTLDNCKQITYNELNTYIK